MTNPSLESDSEGGGKGLKGGKISALRKKKYPGFNGRTFIRSDLSERLKFIFLW